MNQKFPGDSVGKESACTAGDLGSIPGSGRSLGEGIHFSGSSIPGSHSSIPHSSILAWRIPWTEEPGGLQSLGLQSRT